MIVLPFFQHINSGGKVQDIKFFASFLHAHTAGNGIWTKIVRNGKEILELIRDENYDFDYQVRLIVISSSIFCIGCSRNSR